MRVFVVAVSSLLVAGGAGVGFQVTTVDVPDEPRRLDAADVDGDGDVDLCVVSDGPGQTSSLQVLLNDGGGAFTPGWSASHGAGSLELPWDLDLADTDNDGDPDLLYAVPSGAPYERFNDGSGNFDTFGSIPSYSLRAAQEPGDLDDDGDIDLVYYEEDIIGYFGTLKGEGDGTFEFDFATEIWSGLGGFDLSRRFVLGDVNVDGLLDTAMASRNGLQIIKGASFGPPYPMPGWQAPEKIYTAPCLDVALADFDGNSRLDVVATVPSEGAIVVMLIQPTGAFGPPSLYSAGTHPGAIAVADLDLDGAADVIVANPRLALVHVLHGTGAGGFGAPEPHVVGRRPTDVLATDLDADGDADIAVTCGAAGHVAVLTNDAL
jgi:hypothetical protein